VKSNKNFSKYSHPLIASMLVGGGLLQLAAPVLAEGTAAGTTISNTATASYEDPSDPTKPLNTVSNTVEVKVAEVAGITVVADTFSLVKGTSTGTANTGTGVESNDTVNFDFTVTNVGNDPSKLRIPGTAASTGASTVTKVQYLNGTTWTDIPNGGEYITPTSKLPGETVKVRVVVSILPNAAANTPVTVTLGNTVTPGLQNVTRDATTGDVYTVDDDTAGGTEVLGAPENGVREAAASQTITIGATPQSYATVTKVRTANDTTSITYNLGMSVANSAPTGTNKLAADLQGTPIKLNTASNIVNKVLVADAVPTGTTVGTLTAPSGSTAWTAVYTISPIGTAANDAIWLPVPNTGVPVNATRVGFIADGPIAKGTTVSGFSVKFNYDTTIQTNGGTIASIAQVFGATNEGGTDVSDESGDQFPNNMNSDGTTSPMTDGQGIATDPDSNNNNTGTTSGGETNVFIVTPPGQTGILNGTSNTPEAVGPTGNNDDFTNLTTPIPQGTLRTATVNPAALGFANTFQLSATSPQKNVCLMPTTPTVAASLPTNTLVTISYGSSSKSFTYDGTKFVNGTTTTGSAATCYIVPNVNAGTKVNYEVTIDLPDIDQRKGYGVPITAYADTIASGTDFNPDTTKGQNTTIDRIYAGYLQLDKKAQILDKDGVTVIEDYIATPTKKAAPGQMIRYQITYSNVSEVAPAGSGSLALSAKNVVITENGAVGGNNWAASTTHKSGSASDSTSGVVSFDNGNKTNADVTVTVYKDSISNVAPQGSGTFTFTRIVN
jgi:hypothetical protein